MALSPEDVFNKKFTSTRLREGYDQDEVDDFLDEIVVEFRSLNQQEEELRQRLVASDSRINELQRQNGQVIAEQLQEHISETGQQSGLPFPSQTVDASILEPSNTSNLLQLARRLHEEHVQEGIQKRDALIAEGHATAARLVSEAEAEHKAGLRELEQEQALVQNRIDELKSFEREYRNKLRGFIKGQLDELSQGGADEAPDAGVAPQAAVQAN
ncbi:MAG: DivIVA domain-containing protein [Microbacteriaceae bacterium]